MEKTRIQIMDRGPLIVKGEIELLDAEGHAFAAKKQVALCRCGLSQQKPFCDGTHKGKFDDCARASQTT